MDQDGDGVPDLLESAEDAMRLHEIWKPGNSGVVISNAEKFAAHFETVHLEYLEEYAVICGTVGQVTKVFADKTLMAMFYDEDANATEYRVPVASFRKVQIVDFYKPAMTNAEECGLMLRQTPFGGLQMETPLEGTRAWDAGLGEFFGQWLTHVGDTPVMTYEQFEAAEGGELRLEKRVTLPYEFAYRKLEQKVNGANLLSDLRVFVFFVIIFTFYFLLDRDTESAFYITHNMREPALGNEIPEIWTDGSGIGCEEGADIYPIPYKWEKTFWDLANSGDWNVWIVTMAIKSLWDFGKWSTSFGPTMSGNVPLGAVRFRVIRMSNSSCDINRAVIPNNPELGPMQVCYGKWDNMPHGGKGEMTSNEWSDVSSYLDRASVVPEKLNARPMAGPVERLPDGVYDPALYTQWRSCDDMNPGHRWNPPWTSGQDGRTYHCGGYYFEIPYYRFRAPSDASGTRVAAVPPTPEPATTDSPTINGTTEAQSVDASNITTDAPTAGTSAPSPTPISTTPVYEQTSADEAIFEYKRRACAGLFEDTATRLITMEFIEYSPTADSFLSTRVLLEVGAGGAWIPGIQFRTFQVWTTKRLGQTVFDFFFLGFVFYYVGDFVSGAKRKYRRSGSVMAILDPWVILEFLNLSMYVMSFGFRFTWMARCVDVSPKVDVMETQGFYPGLLDEIEWLYMMQVYINCCNCVLTFMKLLKYMRLNQRFGILTETLSDCRDSIVGVMIIFIIVILAFAVTGNTLFGAQMYEFRSMGVSFSTLLRMLLGEMDYEAMKREQRVLAGFFFWSFIILCSFILLNFLIGVMAESFGNVSGQVQTEPLEKVLEKTKEDMKLLYSKKVFLHWLHMRFRKCHTRESLLEQCIDAVECWRDDTYVMVVDEDNPGKWRYKDGEETECQIINRQEFIGAVRSCGEPPGDVMRCLGEEFVGYIWNHLVYEFHRGQEVENLQAQMRKASAFQKGCKSALSEKLHVIETFSSRMGQLRTQVEHMGKLLAEKRAEM